jgi:hypothetical protein
MSVVVEFHGVAELLESASTASESILIRALCFAIPFSDFILTILY